MFYSLTGTVSHTEPGVAVIDVGGVAFKCLTSMGTLRALPRTGSKATLYTYLNVREDALDLYGFYTMGELNCYKLLTAISGVGPKLAQRIVLELKDKVKGLSFAGTDLGGIEPGGPSAAGNAAQAAEALVTLGYSPSEAAAAVGRLDSSLPAEELIRLALKSFGSR